MKADVVLKYHEILTKQGPAEASLYFALQFEGNEWYTDETFPGKADYLTRVRYAAEQKRRQQEGMLLALEYFGQALAAKDAVTKARALAGQWRTMQWVAKHFFDERGYYANDDKGRQITAAIKASIEWRIVLRAINFPRQGYWPRRMYVEGTDGSIIDRECWHLEKLLSNCDIRYKGCLERFTGKRMVLWALGVISELGLDGESDLNQAIRLYEQALSMNCAAASWRLGDILMSLGREDDARKAYTRGVELGHPIAGLRVAELSKNGTNETIELLVKAARAGVGDAWYALWLQLSTLKDKYAIGEDELEAIYKVAIGLGSSKAIREEIRRKDSIEDQCLRRREVGTLWTRLAKSFDAKDCFEAAHYISTHMHGGGSSVLQQYLRAAKLGSAEAMYVLGQCYDPTVGPAHHSGRTFENTYRDKDELIAFMWYEKAAKYGSPDGQYVLANYYKEGHIVAPSAQKCYELTALAAQSFHLKALFDVAMYLKSGYGCLKDVMLAIEYLKTIIMKVQTENSDGGIGLAGKAALEVARIYDDDSFSCSDINTAIEYYLLAANTYGNPEAHRRLSECYELGYGVSTDVDKASEHLVKYICGYEDDFENRISARVNRRKIHNSEPLVDMPEEMARCIEIAYAYETGIRGNWRYQKHHIKQILEPNATEAYKWYCRAFEKGMLAAGLRCAEMLVEGIGCTPNLESARTIYAKLAEAGYLEAAVSLSQMYLKGRFVQSDGREGVMYWLQKASELGDDRSRFLLGKEIEAQKGGMDALGSAVVWYKRSHSEEAFLRMARYYREGLEGGRDIGLAARYYRMCASITARLEFSDMCRVYGESKRNAGDNVTAFKWFLRAARLKNPYGQLRLAEMYFHGEGVRVSLAKAAQWNYWAAECGDAEGQWRIGVFCELGIGIDQTLESAVEYYKKAAAQNHVLAKLHLFELGYVSFEEIQSLVEAGCPEACYIHARCRLRQILENGNGGQADGIDTLRRELAIAINAGISDAAYDLYLCNSGPDSNFEEQVEALKVAVVKGSHEALLQWSRALVSDGKVSEAIPKLWELYANGYKEAGDLLLSAYKQYCDNALIDDMSCYVKRINELCFVKARLAALSMNHDKGVVSPLLHKFVTPLTDSSIDIISDKFSLEFNSYRQEPIVQHDDYDEDPSYRDDTPDWKEESGWNDLYGSDVEASDIIEFRD